MAKFLRRVTVVGSGDDAGAYTLLKSKKRGKKKTTRWLRPTERVVRQYMKAERKCWTDAVRRHGKARKKKKDKWLTDGLGNSLKSMDKGSKVLGKI
jgi:hypothetical protein